MLTDDLAIFDAVEPVALLPPGATAPTPVARALKRRVSLREAEASGGAYTQADVKWRLSVVDWPDMPRPGTMITDGESVQWTVLAVESSEVTGVWVCVSRRLELTDELSQRVTFLQAVWQPGPSGAPVATWITAATDVLVRIQPLTQAIEVEHQRRIARMTHRIFVADPISLDGDTRVVDGSDVYDVLGYDSPERIDRFIVLRGERR